MSDIVWSPCADAAAGSNMARFARQAGIDAGDYARLHAWSISDPGAFWGQVWDFADVIGTRGEVAFVPDPARWMTGARFFPGARLNLAENLMRRQGSELALIERDETGFSRQISAQTLRAEVARVAQGLRKAGVRPGDRVATLLPNRTECLVVVLATAAVGAVWTSCSPDFGATAILDRIGQVAPKVLFAASQVRYGGKDVLLADRIGQVADQIEGLGCLVLVGAGGVTTTVPVRAYDDFGTPGADLVFERVPFDAPVFILYTSGTTGKPKAIVHRTGGVLLQLAKEHLLHGDMSPGDRILWYSNTAWMMYHWMLGAMAARAVLVLYDGAPVLRTASGLDCAPLWQSVQNDRLTHLGISPKYLATLASEGYAPGTQADISSLRWLLSAGSPVAPWQYDWIYSAIGDVGFASISGGTEVMGCFLLGSALHPVRRGALTVKGLGMAVNVLDDRGAPVIGRAGELVCTEPFPSMPLTFWGEGGDARYHDTYFAQRPEIWTHGDHATLNADGTVVIHGRSDFTLNPGGVRIGTADIYNICDRYPEIADSLVFGRPVADDEEIVLCLKMAPGAQASPALAARLRAELRSALSPRHVPAAIHVVQDIPYTINAKRVEGAARAMACGQTVRNMASLANPECLAQYAALADKEAL